MDPISIRPQTRTFFPLRSGMVEDTLQIIIPLTDFPRCIVGRCKTQFFGQTFSRSVKSLTNHLLCTHGIEVKEIEYWCSLCGNYMSKNPHLHSCFQNIAFYNVDFTKYTFPYNCNVCQYGTNSITSLDKHLCRYTPHHQLFPSSDPQQTPPHIIFQDNQPEISDSVPSAQAQPHDSPTSSMNPSSVPATFSLVDKWIWFSGISSSLFIIAYSNCI